MLCSHLTHALALFSLITVAPAQDKVWVVDAAGSGDFSEIADALPATGEGWVLLVRPGVYDAPVVLDNQGMTIVPDGTGAVVLTQQVQVRNLGFGRDLILSGLELQQGFLIEDCNGLVRMQDCITPPPADYVMAPAGTQYWEWPGCGFGVSRHTITSSRAVTLVDCEFHAAHGEPAGPNFSNGWDGSPGHHALLVEDSSVALYDCMLVGGDGGPALASGHFPVAAGAGGDGLHLEDDEAWARITRGQASGGAGGTFVPGGNGSFGVMFGCDGEGVRGSVSENMQLTTHPDLTLEVPAVLRGGVAQTLSVEGPAGAGLFLVTSNEPFWRPLHRTVGILHLQVPLGFTNLGSLPASGVLDLPFSDAGPALQDEFVSLQLQVFAVQNGSRFLSQPRRVVVVDPGL